MKKFILSLFATAYVLGSFAQVRFVEAENIEDYQAIIYTARQNEKLLLVALHNGGGAFKDMYMDGVFDNAQVRTSLANYFPIAIDTRDEMGARFASIYPIDTLPSFFFMTQDELALEVQSGYLSAAALTQKANEVYENRNRYDLLVEKYQNHQLDQKQWLELLELYSRNFSLPQTVQLALEFLAQYENTQLLSPPVSQILVSYGLDLETPYPNLVINHKAGLKENLKDFSFEEFYAAAYSYNLDLAIENADSALLEKLVSDLLPHDPAKEISRWEMLVETYHLYAEETGDYHFWSKGTEIAAQELNSEAARHQLYYDQAYEIIENHDGPEAVAAAHKLATAAAQTKDFPKIMLAAYTSYLSEEYQTSLSFLEDAVKIVQSPEELRSVKKLEALNNAELN
jgi:hypothetical protein